MADMLTRCFEIARECLTGDPFREVPELEAELDRLAAAHTGSQDAPEAGEDVRHLPAYLVADNALGLAGELVQEAAHG